MATETQVLLWMDSEHFSCPSQLLDGCITTWLYCQATTSQFWPSAVTSMHQDRCLLKLNHNAY